ncbi:DUF2771 family protein [Segniliparus rugosus]|uniref:DUF2771 domain-containing protein n=1 Tax=Segniliparus rugosus (strain ATCC BAA-974 / DSM 45345 / CCUG 50838 / CIP 108380 / JCM 13579 / CDC 945) TaxID=679197 RepID=E5XUN4_SEGRC|nr:DUF2771 family protein [Segniliparus rugosus]EFV11941.1 hypothetical protein HMPREF9336_03206 [Segniliparus rugosus ATCC BAA-974]
MFKKPSFILGVVAVVAVVTAVVATTLALRAPKQPPRVSLWVSSGTYARVEPLQYCDIDIQHCLTELGSVQPTHIAVGPDDRVLVSVPEEVAQGWLLDVVWFRQTPEGVQLDHPEPRTFLKKGEPTFATWIEPKGDGWQLRSLTVHVPSRVLDPETDGVLWSATWLACTDSCELSKVRISG